jgi:hypothetical protein
MNKFLKLDVLNKIIWIGLIIIQKVQNYFYIWNVTVERDLIKSFEETFTKVEQYGNEYFEGDPEDMKVSNMFQPQFIIQYENDLY